MSAHPTKNNEGKPQLAHISIIDPGEKLTGKLTDMFKTLLHGKTHDALGELAITLIQPQDTSVRYNGGAWIEGFDRVQIPHTHKNDSQNASERYLLVLPVGANGVVDVLDNDCNMERYVFEKDKLHLLHFDGASPHRFSIMGGKKGQEKGAKLYAVAIHSRDVATSLEALIDQTDIHCQAFPKWDPESLNVFPPEAPRMGDMAANEFVRQISALDERLKEAETDPRLGRALANILSELALGVARHGDSYGNSTAFADVSSLRNWTDASTQISRRERP